MDIKMLKNLYLEQELRGWGQMAIRKMKSINSHFTPSAHFSTFLISLPCTKFFLCTTVDIDSFLLSEAPYYELNLQ